MAGVMAALIGMNDCFCMQRNAMVLDQEVDRFEYKVNFKRRTEYIRKDLFCEGIQDCRKVSKCPVIWKITDIRKELPV